MAWMLVETDDFSEVGRLSEQICEPGQRFADLAARPSGHRLHGFLLQRDGEAPAGFAVLSGAGSDVELLLAGVLPARRRQGGGSFLLEQTRIAMAEKGYARLRVAVGNRGNLLLQLLLKQGFQIIGSAYDEEWGGLRIALLAELKKRREIRYALTEECNFKCLFCHNEGLGHEKRSPREDADVLRILTEAVRQGFSDITLTGGEPLLRKNRLFFLLDGLARLDAPPALTLVTNGALLDQETVDQFVAYPGEKKIHFSLHAADADRFAHLTGTGNPALFARVIGNIRRATEAGLKVKTNCVLVKGVNHDRIFEAIELSRSLGAAAIKFIDLLVLSHSPADYSMYYDTAAILGEVAKVADPAEEQMIRRHLYFHRQDTRFHIEVQKCTCALGCGHCRELRDRTLSSDLHFHPCFVLLQDAYAITAPEDLAPVLEKGDRIIDVFAHRYKDSSPTLIEKKRYVSGWSEFVFAVDCQDRFRSFLNAHDFALTGRRMYHLELFRPRFCSAEWDRFERVLKLGWPSHDQSRVNLTFTDQRLNLIPDLGLEVSKTYLEHSGPMQFKDEETARKFLDRLDFDRFQDFDLDMEIWRRKDLEISLALGATPTVRILGEAAAVREKIRIFSDYAGDFEGLRIPYYQYLYEGRPAMGQKTGGGDKGTD